MKRTDCNDVCGAIIEYYAVDASKNFLEVCLNYSLFGRLADDF